ncbi:uncharacterized protein LOC124162972 [Ischnura elegans]|uniref:uncharacterized protein LOC124162972 n=1 Tax=Ischnura elegans TaxID=197161 RepID=UPI001ED89722|nr:uncharacterized protein LOC124162972 [Ischnura elegans]
MRSRGEFRSRGSPLLILCLSLALSPGLSYGAGSTYKEYAGFLGMEGLPLSAWTDMTKTPVFPVLPLVVSQITSSGGDELCRTQSEIFLRELRNFTLWAVQMFDASTKFPDGVVSGNSYHMGHFDQCTGIKVDLSNGAAQNMLYGQYCLAEINFMEEQEVQQIRNYTLDPYSMKFNPKRTAWDRIKYAGDPTKSRRDVIHWSLCIPASCSPASVEDALVQAMNWVNEVYGKSLNIKVRIPERMCITNRNDEFLNAYDITFSVFLTALSITVIAVTAYDLNTMTDNEENAGTKTDFMTHPTSFPFQCVPQSWYLSCDVQFYIPSLFIVYLIWKKPRIGLILLGIATFLSLLIPFLIIFIEEKDATLLPYIRNLKDIQSYENFTSFYIKAHNRACPYLVGIFTGFIFYKFRDSKFKFTKIQSHVGFTCCFILFVATIISGYLFYYPGNQYNALESAFYGSCFRISWAASIGFLLFVFSKGDLGLLKQTVEWKAFIPLSRLTYCAYLVHTIIQLYHIGSLRKPEYISVPNVLWQTAGDIFVTFLASLLLCLSIEAPTRAIEKVLFRRS